MQGSQQQRRQMSSIPISPVKNQIDFMAQKLVRLQEDYNDVCAQLQRVRTKLRKAEDFQIKYELLNKQKISIQQEALSKDKFILEYQSQIKEMEVAYNQKKSLQTQTKIEKENLLRQVEQWRIKFLQAEEISSRIRAEQEYRMGEKLATEMELMKKHFLNQEEELRSRIRILEITLAQKQALEGILREKGDKNTGEKDKEIERLQENLSKAREEHLQYAEEKNAEIKHIAEKFEKLFSHQISKLKHLQETNSEKFSLQVQGLKGLLELKNNQITQLITQSNQMRQSYLEQKTELLKQISLLREKMFQRQRESQLQLYNLKERLINLHRVDLQKMNQNFEKINLNLEENLHELEQLIKKKDKDIADITQKFDQRKTEMQSIIQEKDSQIIQLQEKLRHTTDINAKEIDNLHSSFHKITTEKGQLSTDYQSTFTFLNNQITKLTSSNELKNQEIKELHLEISQIKKNTSQHVKDLQKKWKQERKQREEERLRERQIREQLQVQFREKQQKWRHRERILQREKEKEEREKIKQKVSIEELQKNVQRLTRHVKQNEERLKQEMQRNQSSFVQSGAIRRELTGEIQRQRAQFQAVKKMQIDQVHRQYDIEIGRLTNQNQKLMNQLSEVRISFDKLQEEYNKIMNNKKNVDRINKEKTVDYQKKMAALNAEINLTQNLYNSFISAKSKTARKPSQGLGN